MPVTGFVYLFSKKKIKVPLSNYFWNLKPKAER
jgi:hypothetical protein